MIPKEASIVIIGGGISGCSLAYHLSKLGWKDIVLLERKKLTSGTTWHAAGLIGQLRQNINMTKLAKYSVDLYSKLEKETGIFTGMKHNGSLTIALTENRKEEIQRQASMARAFDVEVHQISKDEVLDYYPLLNINDVVSAVHLPNDCQCDPANIAMALAKGAKDNGVKIFEDTNVSGLKSNNGRVSGVLWEGVNEKGMIKSENVANCSGMWARDFANRENLTVPLHACEHFYVLTEPIEKLGKLPVLRVPDEYTYYKEDAGKLLIGAFEPKSKPWPNNKIPDDFCFDQLPDDFEHFEPVLEMALKRLPILNKYGIQTYFNGPESFTPDDKYYLGEVPNLKGFWVAAGYNSIGIASSGGAGMALSHWINDGYPPFDLWDVDIRRAQPFQRNKLYLKDRVSETLGLLYADHFPNRQFKTARNIRRSPIHHLLEKEGAVFGEIAGWERANWFAFKNQERKYIYDWNKQNWFENHKQEHQSIRENIGLIDMSSFGKIRIEGEDACKFLQYLCSNNINVKDGKIVYSQMLNKGGGIESDLTVTRIEKNIFLLIVPVSTIQRDLFWINKHKTNYNVTITDITPSEAVFLIMGPNSRNFLQSISPNDLSNNNHPFGYARNIELGYGFARAHRISYVGELGWELYISAEQSCHIYEFIRKEGEKYNLKLCGLHSLDSCRIEKAYRHFGHDITDEDHVLEAGLGFAVDTKKNFIGKEAVVNKLELGLNKYLFQFQLLDPSFMLFHNEPILRNGEIVSYITSGNFGHSLGSAIGLGYVPCKNENISDVLNSDFEIEISGHKIKSKISTKPLYDPRGRKIYI